MLLFNKKNLLPHVFASVLSTCLVSGFALAQTASPPAPTSEQATDSSKILAEGEGFNVTENDITLAAEDQGIDLRGVSDSMKRDVLISLVADIKAMASLAKAEKLDQTENFKNHLEYVYTKTLADEYLKAELKKRVTPKSLEELYEKLTKEVSPEQEVKAGHILLKTEEEAKKILERLNAGEDFAILARENSIDPTAKDNSGDLGYFTKERTIPDFSKVAFETEIGKISAPVKTEFGWHIIKVEDKREVPVPSFEEVKSQLEAYQIRLVQQEVTKEVRSKTKFKRLDQPEKSDSGEGEKLAQDAVNGSEKNSSAK